MGDFCFCVRTRRPRLFLIFCCLFSVALGAMSSIFFYYPEGVNVPMFAAEEVVAHNHQHHKNEKGYNHNYNNIERLESSFVGQGQAVASSRHHVFFDIKEDEYETSLVGNSGKIRHQAHHFDHDRSDGAEEEENRARAMYIEYGLEDLEEKSVLSQVIESRLIHLDLKGAPPRVHFIKELLRIARSSGINGVLIEWEDTFPWKGALENITLSRGGYNLSEVEEIISYAEKTLYMEVIPLIQTFGHVEFIIKSEELRHLREVDEDPQSFCPSKPGTMDIITEMIDQILEVHKNSRYIHIGCDEVYNLHVCSLCTAAFDYRDDVFLHHVNRVATLVRSRDKIPIIWDDMLRSIPAKRLTDSGIGNLVEPMVWVYAEDVDRFVGWESWDKYSKIFPTLWAASAFKGAFGETLTIPPLSRHADNAQRWVDVVARESVRWQKGIGGIVLTGWQRYDHFAVLCELLPTAIPSLVYSSLIISTPNGGDIIQNRVYVPKNQSIASSESPIINIESSTSVSRPSDSMASDVVDLMNNKDGKEDVGKNAASSTTPLYDGGGSDNDPPVLLSRSGRSTRRKIPHPRSLMQKESGMSRFGNNGARGLHARDFLSEGEDKNQLISRQFHRILHCPNHPENIAAAIKDNGDTELSFASRCTFPGVSFFRTLFRLRSLLNEIWELETKILRGRGWATAYNVRHNYSLPSRIDEVIFTNVPRYRRNLSLIAKSAAMSLKTIFNGEVVTEWIEQNIWEAWQVLDSFEKVGEQLKKIRSWPRRPLRSPSKMVSDLGLQAINLFDHEEL